MINFMLFHGTLAHESWVLLWGEKWGTLCNEKYYWLKGIAYMSYILKMLEKFEYHYTSFLDCK